MHLDDNEVLSALADAVDSHDIDAHVRRLVAAARVGLWSYEIRTGRTRLCDAGQLVWSLPEPVECDALLERVHPDDRERLIDLAREAIVDGERGAYETSFRFQSADGDFRWLYVRALAVREREGGRTRVARLIGAFQDVHAMQEAEAALLESEAEYRVAFEVAPVGLVQTDPLSGRIHRVNSMYCDILGYAPSELIGRSFVEVVAPHERANALEAYHRLIRGDVERFAGQTVCRRKDGDEVACRVSAAMLRNDGRPVAAIAVIEDITDEQLTERELRARQAWLQIAMEAGDLGIFEVDIEREDFRSSDTWRTMYGFTDDDAIDMPAWLDRIHPEDRPMMAEAARRLREGETRAHTEYRIQHPRAGVRWLEDNARIVGGAGEPRRLIGVVRDVTERKRFEERIKEAAHQKDNFLAMLGHELRNPVAAIRNGIELARLLGIGDARLDRICGVIERQTHHMSRLIDDLLDVSRIERGKIQLQKQVVDLRSILADSAADIRTAIEREGLALAVELPEAPLWVLGDPTRLAQIFGNLLDNARKFTESPGQVRLDASPEDDGVCVSITDTGLGIDRFTLDTLFEPFQQGAARARGSSGLGLGLALVRGLTTLHGGRIRAHSEGPGAGARFEVWLPLVEAPPATARPRARRRTTTRRVLVIDDNRDSADLLRETLALLGNEVAVAYGGAEGIEAAQRLQPDLVLCDIQLPGEHDGYDVARALRADPRTRGAQLVAVTGFGRAEDRDLARAAGFDQHLIKPVSMELMREILDAS